jgi:hypothetical protein
MNEMYNMGLSIHSLGSGALLGVILINIFFLNAAKDINKFKRLMSILLMPLNSAVLGGVIFTGIVMMAAKHLDFTVANIVMIVISIILIILEVKRSKTLRLVNPKAEGAMSAYKTYAMNIMYIEIVLIALISVWMWWLA